MNSTVISTIEVRRPNSQVAEVWLNRPDLRNAFNSTVIAELTAVFQGFARDDKLRAVVLAGHGKAFCAGADLNWMREMADYDWEQNRADAAKLAEMFRVIHDCPVPVVGRIHGDCYAGGVGLAAVCDIVIASDNAGLCLSEARLGLLPATIAPYVIRAMGERAAQRYFLTAERFSAADAKVMGFAHECVAPEKLDATVQAIVEALRINGPFAVRACKQLVRDIAGQPLTTELREDTVHRIADIRASTEGKEGVQSFLQKRAPAWTNQEAP